MLKEFSISKEKRFRRSAWLSAFVSFNILLFVRPGIMMLILSKPQI